MPIILLLKGWKFVLEKMAELLGHIIKYCQALPLTNFGNQMNDGMEEEKMLENIIPNGIGDGKCVVVFLAVEVWADVLGFVKRIQLARMVSLTNRRIHQICWPRLHGDKVMAHAVGEIFFGSRDELGRPPMAVLLKDGREVPIPNSPVPIYISGFYHIRIMFLDEQVLAFFKLIAHSMHAKPISISIIMEMSNIDDKQCAYVNQLLEIIREDKSPSQIIHLSCQLANIQYLQHVDNQISRIHLDGYEDSDILHLIQMLASPRPDGQQRVIYLNLGEELASKMVESIKKEFRASTQPVPQPFYLNFYGHNLDIPNSEELNPQTGETLMIVRDGENRMFHIYRHPTGQHAQWAEDARKRIEWTDTIKTFIDMQIQDY